MRPDQNPEPPSWSRSDPIGDEWVDTVFYANPPVNMHTIVRERHELFYGIELDHGAWRFSDLDVLSHPMTRLSHIGLQFESGLWREAKQYGAVFGGWDYYVLFPLRPEDV